MNQQEQIWDLGAGARDAGQSRVLAGVSDEWKLRAHRSMLTLILKGEPFSADDLVRIAGLPASRNAVGALFGAYSKRGMIRPCGRVRGHRKARHAGAQLQWVAT
jgi:hypothetical protein